MRVMHSGGTRAVRAPSDGCRLTEAIAATRATGRGLIRARRSRVSPRPGSRGSHPAGGPSGGQPPYTQTYGAHGVSLAVAVPVKGRPHPISAVPEPTPDPYEPHGECALRAAPQLTTISTRLTAPTSNGLPPVKRSVFLPFSPAKTAKRGLCQLCQGAWRGDEHFSGHYDLFVWDNAARRGGIGHRHPLQSARLSHGGDSGLPTWRNAGAPYREHGPDPR
jgi:hypothetical protein